MATLAIELQDGFRDDTVVVRVGGAEVARREHVTTNLVISRADALEVELADGVADVEVALPARGLSRRERVEVAGRTYLLVSVLDGRLELRTTREQPYYM
jgi:hypothetical protein